MAIIDTVLLPPYLSVLLSPVESEGKRKAQLLLSFTGEKKKKKKLKIITNRYDGNNFLLFDERSYYLLALPLLTSLSAYQEHNGVLIFPTI